MQQPLESQALQPPISQSATHYLPHEAPMVLIDDLIEAGKDYAVAKVVVRPELMFTDAQGLPTWVSIELMAQTVSLFAGVQGQQKSLAPKIGFLLGTRKMALPFAYFPMQSELKITATQNFMHDNLGMFVCELQYMQHSIQATLSVYVPDQVDFETGRSSE